MLIGVATRGVASSIGSVARAASISDKQAAASYQRNISADASVT